MGCASSFLFPEKELIEAGRDGDTNKVSSLLKAGTNVNCRDRYGCTALMYAVSKGHTATVELLLQHKADIEAKDNGGNTALLYAAMWGRTATVELLLQHKADIEAKNKAGKTALQWAIDRNEREVVKVLEAAAAAKKEGISFGAYMAKREAEAEAKRQREAAEAKRQAEAEAKRQLEAKLEQEEGRNSALLAAARNNDLELIKTTLSRGANVYAQDADGCTVLHCAAEAGHADAVSLLVQHLDIFAQDADGCTVLHRAAEAGHADTVSLLVQKGGLRLAAMTDKRGKTARDLAVFQQRKFFVESTRCTTNATVALLDSLMAKLDTPTVKKQTDLALDDDLERKYLIKYSEEQVQLRESASSLMEQAEPLRRQHKSLVEDHDSALRQLHHQHATAIAQLETQLHRRNQELSQVMSKMFALKQENEDQLKALRSRVESLSQSYTSSYNASQHPLNPAQYKEMIRTILFSSSNTNTSQDVSTKFSSDPDDLIVGLFEDATAGHAALLCVDEDELNARMGDGLVAMRAEVEALRDDELSFWFEYIVNQESSEQEYPQGTRDKGRAGRRLDDFLKTLQAKEADLKRAEVAALRLYTSPAFSRINGPLRNLERFREKRPHPLAVTVSFIVRGIKKLRRVDASAAAAIQSLVLWRGVKNVRITKQFLEKGGTELGALSTTTALGVAIDFSRSKRSLIFKIVTQNKLQRGADLHWLSIFPSEQEVLWPPLTYLQPTSLTQEVEIDGWHFTVLEVHTTQA